MSENIFLTEELDWLSRHREIEESINESIEESLNVNPLDSGEPDLIPYQRAVKAAHITIEAAQKKLIAGPYNDAHWQIICKHFNYPSLTNKEKKFWQIFSYDCASYKEEDETWPKERIYMEAMKEMLRVIEEGTFEHMESEDIEVANLNSNMIQKIKGEGVNSRFVD